MSSIKPIQRNNQNNNTTVSNDNTTTTTVDNRSLIDRLGGIAPLISGALPNPVIPSDRITVLSNNDETLSTYSIYGEDHTLGNALRYMINRDRRTSVCGYSIPHPSEYKINIRIQTYNKVPSSIVLTDNCDQLSNVCDVLQNKIQQAEQLYYSKKQHKQ